MSSWTGSQPDPREAVTNANDAPGEVSTVLEYLAHYRMTLEMKCEDLSPAQMATRSVPPSDLSLLGMVRHLARVEQHWFQRVLGGQLHVDRLFSDDPTGGFRDLAPTDEAVAAAWDLWHAHVAASRLEEARWPEGTWGDLVALGAGPDAERIPVRDVMVHLVEEYARHLGHVDLLRECLDGRTGS